mgnify:CR=1 FL=1
MKVGDLIRHKWGNDIGIVVGRPDPARQPPPNNWHVMFGSNQYRAKRLRILNLMTGRFVGDIRPSHVKVLS